MDSGAAQRERNPMNQLPPWGSTGAGEGGVRRRRVRSGDFFFGVDEMRGLRERGGAMACAAGEDVRLGKMGFFSFFWNPRHQGPTRLQNANIAVKFLNAPSAKITGRREYSFSLTQTRYSPVSLLS